ncbi:MAG: hypothetical protein R3C12_20885 [Planctomycetaceae bacterium]
MKSTPQEKQEPPRPAEQNATAEQAYREMIQQVARAMAGNNVEGAVAYLSPEFTARHVELFVDGNFEKRIDVLLRLMPLVSEDEDFEDFESLAEEFADTVPVTAYEGSSEECDAMLAWMQETLDLTPAQQDTVNCQRARYAVEFLARRKRAEHIRFQEQVSIWRPPGERSAATGILCGWWLIRFMSGRNSFRGNTSRQLPQCREMSSLGPMIKKCEPAHFRPIGALF